MPWLMTYEGIIDAVDATTATTADDGDDDDDDDDADVSFTKTVPCISTYL